MTIFKLKTREPRCEPGATDDCRLTLTVKMIPSVEGVVVFCPNGYTPMPGENVCRPYAVGGETSDGRRCPDGFAPGPDDGPCVPVRLPKPNDEILHEMKQLVIEGSGTVEERLQMHRLGEKAGAWILTHESEAVIDGLQETLGQEWEREMR